MNNEFEVVLSQMSPEELRDLQDKAINMRVKKIEFRLNKLEDTMRISGVEQFSLKSKANSVALKALGGKGSPAYEKLSKMVFQQLWRDFKKEFHIPRYSELPKVKLDAGLYFLEEWGPDTSLKIKIQQANNQTELKLV